MELKHDFEIPAGIEESWSVLLDIPRIAPCMPGAELTEVADERNFKGTAKVKVGPVALKFAGTAQIVEVDDAAHTAKVLAKGADAKGRGNADATVNFALVPVDAGRTRVDVVTDLNLAGSVAQYGRASGLIDAIAGQIIADFVRNLEAELASGSPAGALDDASAHEGVSDAAGSPAAVAGEAVAPAAPRAAKTNEISGISLFFRALMSIIRGWFGSAKS